jgi:transcriptional regulator with XRE-family HTH domain
MSTALPEFARRLRAVRRARGMKQSHVADLASVCQSTVCRWERGVIEPEASLADQVLRALCRAPPEDSAVRRLIENCRLPVHLVTDADHRLLAASPSRLAEWGVSSGQLMGQSLWRFATPEIVEAESSLGRLGWWEEWVPAPVQVCTRAGGTEELRIAAGLMVWERLWLSDGTAARLCTSSR